jgi:uncharacterized Tic20 family protein
MELFWGYLYLFDWVIVYNNIIMVWGGKNMENKNFGSDISRDERMWGMLCHLSALAGFIIPFGNLLGPLIIYLIKKEDYLFVNDQGKESLNFQISVFIYGIISGILVLLLVGVLLLFALGIFALIFVIIASIKANEGEHYRYPMTIRFLK